MKNSPKFRCPCLRMRGLSDETAYEIYILLSRLAGDFFDRHFDQIQRHERAIDFWMENGPSDQQLPFEDDLPF